MSKVSSTKSVALKQHYFTPSEANLPPVAGSNTHKPIPLSSSNASSSADSVIDERNCVLDGFLLLEATGMQFPDDARQATLNDKGLRGSVEEDLAFFTGLLSLDVSDNYLNISHFGIFPRLKELRMACNRISSIPQLEGFEKLIVLDLSYNNLNFESVLSLSTIPQLKELDLCGNNLRGLPPHMEQFRVLEKILLEHNKIEDNSTFDSLSCLPNIRVISLAFNFLSKISTAAGQRLRWTNDILCHVSPPASLTMHAFRNLQSLDISFNYFGNDDDIRPLITVPKLATLILYGNPLLGPTGEDPQRIYVEDFENECEETRHSSRLKPMEVSFSFACPTLAICTICPCTHAWGHLYR